MIEYMGIFCVPDQVRNICWPALNETAGSLKNYLQICIFHELLFSCQKGFRNRSKAKGLTMGKNRSEYGKWQN